MSESAENHAEDHTAASGRRWLLQAMAGGLIGAGVGAATGHAQAPAPTTAPSERAAEPASNKPITVGMLIYPGMVMLDLTGPMTVLNLLRADIRLVWKDRNPVATDLQMPITPSDTFETCPAALDVLFAPGGITGTTNCMNDQRVLDFLADRGSRARYVTSVCTGSLVLAAAGLLRGYRATSHWAVVDILPVMGAIATEGRVVEDRNRLTGGGVTAGIDFGLVLASRLRNEEMARYIQLALEYAPAPPFRSGTPNEAGHVRTAAAKKLRERADALALDAAIGAAARFKG